MNATIIKRFWLFLLGCMGTRTLLTIISAYASCSLLRCLGWIAILPVLGWAFILFVHPRTTGPEVFGDNIWWTQLRPVHMILWSLFAYTAIQCSPFAWRYLAVDTIFGLLSFLIYHRSQGHI